MNETVSPIQGKPDFPGGKGNDDVDSRSSIVMRIVLWGEIGSWMAISIDRVLDYFKGYLQIEKFYATHLARQ